MSTLPCACGGTIVLAAAIRDSSAPPAVTASYSCHVKPNMKVFRSTLQVYEASPALLPETGREDLQVPASIHSLLLSQAARRQLRGGEHCRRHVLVHRPRVRVVPKHVLHERHALQSPGLLSAPGAVAPLLLHQLCTEVPNVPVRWVAAQTPELQIISSVEGSVQGAVSGCATWVCATLMQRQRLCCYWHCRTCI